MVNREELREELGSLEAELRRLIPQLLVGASPRVVAEEYPLAVTDLADDAREISLEYYADLAPSLSYIPQPFEDKTLRDRLSASARFAVVSPKDTQALLEGTGVRAIHDTSRETLIRNVRKERGKWARIPAYDACGFCRLLGTRGPVYSSKHAALASHDGCGCEARIARPGQRIQRPKYMDGWNDDYERVRSRVVALGGPTSGKAGRNAIVNEWNKELFRTGIRSRSKGHDDSSLRDAA